MKEGLFKAIGLDQSEPRIRLRLADEDLDRYGVFVAVNIREVAPALAYFDSWNKEDYQLLTNPEASFQDISKVAERCQTILVKSSVVIDLEIIGFAHPNKKNPTKGKRKIRKTDVWIHGPSAYKLDTLHEWDLTKWNVIRDKKVLTLL